MYADIFAMLHCVMEHSKDELRDAVARLLVDCPTCELTYVMPVCGGHATAAAFLKSIGGEVSCPAFCGTDVPADRIELEDM